MSRSLSSFGRRHQRPGDTLPAVRADISDGVVETEGGGQRDRGHSIIVILLVISEVDSAGRLLLGIRHHQLLITDVVLGSCWGEEVLLFSSEKYHARRYCRLPMYTGKPHNCTANVKLFHSERDCPRRGQRVQRVHLED